jgi:catechol 2,3-dioxygenase-like lactoylglutathione lyase family enzyme
MKIKSQYPVILTPSVETLTKFYTMHFGYEISFQSDWYVSLIQKHQDQTFELALLKPDHPTIPEGFRTESAGILLNFEVEDCRLEYQRLVTEAGLPILLDIRDEEFGQRHFITQDPAGNMIDIIENIPPSEAFLAQFTEAAS